MQGTDHYERLRELVAAKDPLLVEAVDDVDVTLLAWARTLSPWERLRSTSVALHVWSGFRRDPSSTS